MGHGWMNGKGKRDWVNCFKALQKFVDRYVSTHENHSPFFIHKLRKVSEIFIPLTSEHHHAYGKDFFNVGVRSHVAEADGNQASKGKVDGCAIAGLQKHVVG